MPDASAMWTKNTKENHLKYKFFNLREYNTNSVKKNNCKAQLIFSKMQLQQENFVIWHMLEPSKKKTTKYQ